MNRGQLTLRVQQIVGLSAEAAGEEETLVHDLLYDAILDIKARTRLSMKCLDITVPADAELLDIPDSVLQMDGLYDSEGIRWLRVAPDMVTEGGQFFSLIGSDLIKLYPSTEEREFSVYYVPLPTKMSSDSHDPATETYGGIPEIFHASAIVNYASWKGANVVDDTTAAQGEQYRILYEGKEPGGVGGDIARIKRWVNQHIQPGGRRRPPVDGYRSVNYI